MTEAFYQQKDWRFGGKIHVTVGNKIDYVIKASGETIDEFERNLAECRHRVEKMVAEMRKKNGK